MKRVLFLVPYPQGEAASQRFRFEQYLPALQETGWDVHLSPFLDLRAWKVLYQPGHLDRKAFAILRGYLRRLGDLLKLGRYDAVFIHREASPFGPPWLEWIITRLFKKYTVYDFDDAIWIPNASESNSVITRWLRSFGKTGKICGWSSVVSVGNAYLGDYARKFNSRVVINPTTIDTDEHHNEIVDHDNHTFVIGWTGSHSTVQYLDELVPVFEELEKRYDFELHVICDTPPRFKLKSLRYIKWSKQAEIDDLMNFNVGLMPLPDTEWARGKCGFKALQYMALGVPPVVSNVGVNAEIVDHDVNGCVCQNLNEWKSSLERLLGDPVFLRRLSQKTRDKVVSRYSVQSNRDNFLRLFLKDR